jgi:hypothetical protein
MVEWKSKSIGIARRAALRTAWGLDQVSSQYQARGAALKLYYLGTAMFDVYVPEKHRAVANRTLQLIQEAGYA